MTKVYDRDCSVALGSARMRYRLHQERSYRLNGKFPPGFVTVQPRTSHPFRLVLVEHEFYVTVVVDEEVVLLNYRTAQPYCFFLSREDCGNSGEAVRCGDRLLLMHLQSREYLSCRQKAVLAGASDTFTFLNSDGNPSGLLQSGAAFLCNDFSQPNLFLTTN